MDTHHLHTEHELTWTATGRVVVTTAAHELVADETQSVWLPAGTAHTIRLGPAAVVLPLWLPADEQPTAPAHACAIARTPALNEAARTLLHPGLHDTTALTAARQHLMDAVAAGVARPVPISGPPPLPRDPRARAAAVHILSHLAEDLSLDDVARRQHTSTRTLQRAFTAETGLTIARWRTAARLDRAAILLRSGQDIPVAARRCGYKSVSAFTTAFTHRYGISPGRYRRVHRRRAA